MCPGLRPRALSQNDMDKRRLTPGTKVQVLLDGKVKKGVVTGTVPTLWGGTAVTVKVGTKEQAIDYNAIVK